MSTSDDSSGELECPTCGRDDFSSRRYMRSHHKQAHGESIAGFSFECEWCGQTGTKQQIDDYDEHQFCSTDCFHEWKSAVLVGEKSPAWQGRTVVVECEWCGEETEKALSRRERNEQAFCSIECYGEWTSENRSGSDSPKWKGRPQTVQCAQCGDSFEQDPRKIERNNQNFCSKSCYSEWMVGRRTGDDHPRWCGGRTISYGPNWHRKRLERLELDGYKCAICGMSDERHEKKHGTGLHVHHIKPVLEYLIGGNTIDYEKANRLDNLLSLCAKCHARNEGKALIRVDA